MGRVSRWVFSSSQTSGRGTSSLCSVYLWGGIYPCRSYAGGTKGSIIAIVATDAPLLPHQLKRLARRVPMGMARTGAVGSNSSGDIFLAFSTANKPGLSSQTKICSMDYVANNAIDKLFNAVVEATEEAILDSMLCAETMVGRDGNTSHALPHAELLELLKAQGRIRNG